MNRQKFWSYLLRATPLRIAMTISVMFAALHFVIESELFETGPLSKRGLIHLLDLKALDLKFQSHQPQPLPDPRVVIAAIDEKSVEQYGLWPWSRHVIADFVAAMRDGGARVVAFDAVFSDEDKNSSYVSVKKFLDSYAAATLDKDAGPFAALTKRLETAAVSSAQHVDGVDDLVKRIKALHTPHQDLVRQSATRVRLEATDLQRKIASAREALIEVKARSDAFAAVMRKEVAHISPDDALAAALQTAPSTILGYFNFYRKEEIVGVAPNLMAQSFDAISQAQINQVYERTFSGAGGQSITMLKPLASVPWSQLKIRHAVASRPPLPKFAAAAKAFGYFNIEPDADGPMRHLRLLNLHAAHLYPALSLVAVATYLQSPIFPINGSIKPGKTLDGIALDDNVFIPTDLHGTMLVNYYKDPESYFPKVSVADLMDADKARAIIKDKIVLFGMTAQGLYDLRPTPFSANTPGVYIHAMAIQNMLDGLYVRRFYGLALVEILGCLLLGAVMGMLVKRLRYWGSIAATVGFTAGLYALDFLVIFPAGYWTLNVLPTLQATAILVAISGHGYLTEGRERRKIRKVFQFYLTKSIVDEVLKDTTKLHLGGQRRVCTVLFSDIRGFTSISERLSPEELVQLLNNYLTPMTNIVFKHEGTLDKYIGDAMMAIFGAPVAFEAHAQKACFAALDMLEELAWLNDTWRSQGRPEIDIGIGINTGTMAVGNMGSEVRFDYTVMGDNVNLGSRLEGLNKLYGTHIIISEATCMAAGRHVLVRELDLVRVKGKLEPVRIFELLGRGTPNAEQAALIENFAAALQAYRQQQWSTATALFERISRDILPADRPTQIFLERCHAMQKRAPQQDWDGVYNLTEK